MFEHNYDEFSQLLDDAYDLIGSGANKIISGGAKSMFWNAMQPFTIEQFRAALSAHCIDKKNGAFTPKPAHIIEQLDRMTSKDGHPAPEEAWALALQSADEMKTVVLTSQIVEAFQICRPVYESSGAISARKTFLEVYERILSASRYQGIRPVFFASLGTDPAQKESAIKAAVSAGLLPAPIVRDLLPPPAAPTTADVDAHAQLATVKALLLDTFAKKEAAIEATKQREREQVAEAKRGIADASRNYRRQA